MTTAVEGISKSELFVRHTKTYHTETAENEKLMKMKNCFILHRKLLQGLDALVKKLTFLMKFSNKKS